MISRTILILFIAAIEAYSIPITDLTLRETAGIARINEDVTMGVPLPENGFYTDTSRITLRDESDAIIPCEVKAVSHWYKNPQCLRWVQLNFPCSVPANGVRTMTLSLDPSSYALSTNLTAVDDGTAITVNTGKIRFVVRKSRFNLLDQVWVDESGAENYSETDRIVASHNRGIIHYLNDSEFLSSNDSASTVVIERRGPGVVTLKAVGTLKSGTGAGTLTFVTRIYAYNQSSSIKIYNSIEFRVSNPATTVNIQGLHLEVPLVLSGAVRQAVVGKPGGYSSAGLSDSQEAWCMVKRPAGSLTTAGSVMTGSLGGQVPVETFNPSVLKPRDIGWVALKDNARGCVLSLNYFWQMVPTSVEAYGDGGLVAGLFSKRSGQTPLPFYAGTGRSWETRWTFFNTASADTLRSLAAAGTDRLFALASPFWYTRRTNSAVPLVEIKQDLYTPENWSIVSGWDAKLTRIWDAMLNKDTLNRGLDSYGMLEWGDNPLVPYPLPAPCNVMWNGNYYGLDFFAFEHFYHTGDPRFLRYGIAHARHVEDVHQLHFGDASPNTGSSRYCPPNNHIATDDGSCTPDATGNMSHHKSEGMFMDYYLTGNDYALQCALEAVNWAERSGYSLAVGPSDNVKTYIRRWAHQMYDMVWAYEYNQAPKYYARLWQNWEMFRRNIVTPRDTIGQPFMVGLAMEAVVKMYPILSPAYTANTGSKPDSVAHYLKIWCDSMYRWPSGIGSAGINSNTTLGYAFLSRFYGAEYLTKAAEKAAILPAMPDSVHKYFPQQARNIEMAMVYYAIPESLSAYQIAVEKSPGRFTPDNGIVLSASPSPFYPSTLLRISGLTGNGRPRLRIYTLDGALVRDLSREADNAERSVVWRADGRTSNVYLVKCDIGNKTLTRKIMLMK